MNTDFETAPTMTTYSWPTKKDFMDTVKAYIRYKRLEKNAGWFRQQIKEILFDPFQAEPIPLELEKIMIMRSDLADHEFDPTDTSNFWVCLGKIGEFGEELIDIVLEHHIFEQNPEKPLFILTISLKK